VCHSCRFGVLMILAGAAPVVYVWWRAHTHNPEVLSVPVILKHVGVPERSSIHCPVMIAKCSGCCAENSEEVVHFETGPSWWIELACRRGNSRLSVQAFLQFLAGPEAGFAAGGNLDGGTRAGIAAHARFGILRFKNAKASEIHLVAANQGVGDSVQSCVDRLFDFGLRLAGGGGHRFDQL
jgi:hypothetical protein